MQQGDHHDFILYKMYPSRFLTGTEVSCQHVFCPYCSQEIIYSLDKQRCWVIWYQGKKEDVLRVFSQMPTLFANEKASEEKIYSSPLGLRTALELAQDSC